MSEAEKNAEVVRRGYEAFNSGDMNTLISGIRGRAASARIIYPDATGDGTQVNLSGAVVAKYAPNKANADRLVNFLLSDEAQHIYASGNYEFPVVAGVAPSELVASWGALNADTTPMVEIAAHRKEAAALVDEIKFDEGPQN